MTMEDFHQTWYTHHSIGKLHHLHTFYFHTINNMNNATI